MNKSVAVGLLLGLGVILGAALTLMASEPLEKQSLEWLDNPRALGSFSLKTEMGEFDNRSLVGHWTIVLFGFLHCPDICVTSLSQLAALADSLAENSIDREVTYIFVSVDPGRDSVAEVNQYVRHFDSSIRGVTGSKEQLAKFASGLGVQFRVTPDPEDYSVAHSIAFSVIDPEGAFRGRFRPGFDALDLARSLTSELREASF